MFTIKQLVIRFLKEQQIFDKPNIQSESSKKLFDKNPTYILTHIDKGWNFFETKEGSDFWFNIELLLKTYI